MRKPRFSSNALPSAAWAKLFDIENIEAVLQAAARTGKALSYSETLGQLGYNFSRPKMRALCSALSEIDARAKRAGQPELAVLVVRASDSIPGAGWWTEMNNQKYQGLWEGPEALAYIKKRQAKAFKFWKQK